MSESIASLVHNINSATELRSVSRSMEAITTSIIGQYEKAVRSQYDYYRTVQLGLAACFRQKELAQGDSFTVQKDTGSTAVIVFGSDQGLVGQFNEVMVDFVVKTLAKLPGEKVIWTVENELSRILLKLIFLL